MKNKGENMKQIDLHMHVWIRFIPTIKANTDEAVKANLQANINNRPWHTDAYNDETINMPKNLSELNW